MNVSFSERVLDKMEFCTVFNQLKAFAKEKADFGEFLYPRLHYQRNV